MIRLHDDWRRLLLYAWSVRLMIASAIMSGVATTLTIAQPYVGVNPLVLAAVVGVATTGASLLAIYARIVKQEGLSNGL